MTGYDFGTLSSGDFELLACDVLNSALGLTLNGFPAGPDGGIDLRCVADDGFTTVVQCKHYRGSNAPTFMRAVTRESNKGAIKAAGRYIFITSHPLTPDRECEVAARLGIPVGDVWGPDKINGVLRERPEIELRHFKLWLHSTAVLERFIRAGLWNRTEALLGEVAHQARYWVDVPGYPKARELLDEHGACVIAGGPGVGKSFLAERIMLHALSDGWQVVAPTGAPETLWELAEPGARRLLYLDDFLGDVVLRHDAADVARTLSSFIPYVGRCRDRLRLVMTTRDQVLVQAAHTGGDRLRELAALPFVCRLALADLDEATRMEILLSHIRQSDMPTEVRAELADDNRLRALAAHPSFSPRLIRSVLINNGPSGCTADGVLRELAAAFAEPAALWQASFDALDDSAQRMLLALVTFPGRALAYRDLMEAAAPGQEALRRMRSFRMLESAWVRLIGPPSGRSVVFAHPGCRDFLLGMLEQDEGMLVRDIIGAGLGRLEQVVALSQAAGLLTAAGTPLLAGPVSRPVLRGVLVAHRTLLAARLEGLWHEAETRAAGAAGVVLLRLRDAVALVVCFGDEHDTDWVAREAEALLGDGVIGVDRVPAVPAFALARGLLALSRRAGGGDGIGDTARRWAAAGLDNASGLPDLDAYEDLPDALHTPETRKAAVRRGALIIEDELDRLRHEGVDAADLEAAVHDLIARAEWYAIEFDFADLLDMVEEPSGIGA
jgi:Restriction endonuclease